MYQKSHYSCLNLYSKTQDFSNLDSLLSFSVLGLEATIQRLHFSFIDFFWYALRFEGEEILNS